ncbi:helicase HerA-like domain-containing protein [Sphingosinicella humi]|uniref:ATP-binding protein n=1 Tax=Allosphingosinicella humi TaxID=2068657 RepID=A0A2U2J0T1_9SPHN|nr:helicase HerA-like domain-containing protein [Sphingosinicella humi]PWG01891.1 ATP-binding protein [Sphingosinicella humi]
MDDAASIFIGLGEGGPQRLVLSRANRHGLIAGATGTGKTVTLQGLAESFSAAGVPVFVADVKGDVAGIAMAGSPTHKAHEALTQRAREIGYSGWSYADNPAVFWDLYGEQGHPVRTTVSEMGPLLLSRLMNLNETQEGVLNIAFRLADEDGLLLLNLEDLQALLVRCAEKASELTARYGNVSKASVGAIQRQLLQLESQGGDRFFGEPALEIGDLLKIDEQGRGYVNILAADKLMASPKLYATFLLWLLSELFEELPEVGDLPKPKLVFFFDEAHLLFEDAPKALQDKIEQVVRLIRSKGIGVYFVTQNPIDIPEDVAGQLGNRIQHALRAYTPRDQRAIKAAAETFRINPKLDVETAITELKVGEALVSMLQEDGAPSPVERTLVKPPRSRLGPLTAKERAIIQSISPVEAKYDQAVDRESAEEILKARGEEAAAAAAAAEAREAEEKAAAERAKVEARARAQEARERARLERERRANPSIGDAMVRQVGKSLQRQVANKVARSLVRGLLGGLFRGR